MTTRFDEMTEKNPYYEDNDDDDEDNNGKKNTNWVARAGYVITIDLKLVPENGYIPEPLFDTSGILSFVIGWGNYLPGLHSLCEGKRVGDRVENVSLDAGWGDRNDDLIIQIPKSQFVERFPHTPAAVGKIVPLKVDNGSTKEVIELTIVQVEQDTITVDANPPLAGSSYSCSFTVLDVEPANGAVFQETDDRIIRSAPSPPSTHYGIGTFALGCFWAGELAFMRLSGVVGTQVGYTQGKESVRPPTYEDVCSGKTQHREAITVIYDTRIISYKELLSVAIHRLETIGALRSTARNNRNNNSFIHTMFQEDPEEIAYSKNLQYQPGFYYHTKEQEEIIASELEFQLGEGAVCGIEVKPAKIFYKAEEYHQQYLLKGGQSAKKGAKDPIRCYG